MSKPGMIQLETAHFSNVIGAIQRTSSLTGGAVRGLPSGVVIDGLPGVASFASAISEAQKEFQLGRVRSSLERIRQLETSFNGIVGRWNSTAMTVISSARQGRQGIPLAKLNEVKNAQTRMQQLIRPAEKAFRDLVTALEHEITMEGRTSVAKENASENNDASEKNDASENQSPTEAANNQTPVLPEDFATEYQVDAKLAVQQGDDKVTRVVPPFETGQHYFLAGLDPPRVIRIDAIKKSSLQAFDTLKAIDSIIKAPQIIKLLRQGVWLLKDRT